MKALSDVLDHAWLYRVWQAPFAGRKLRPVLRDTDIRHVQRVLDVGCGPGTNARRFVSAEYVGIDLNPRYIDFARRHYRGDFRVVDVTSDALDLGTFDFILANSLLHHIDTPGVERVLAGIERRLSEDGHVHIIDLVLPPRTSIARTLALSDRGQYPRPLEEWRSLLTQRFEPVSFVPFTLRGAGIPMWELVYFKGRRRR